MSASDNASKPEAPQVEQSPQRIWESRVGRIVRTREQGQVLVDFDGNMEGPLEARSTVELPPEQLRAAIAGQRPVELRFEDGDPRRPVVVAIAPVISLNDLLQGLRRPSGEEDEDTVPAGEDGARVIQARDELVLQCGNASITLRRNGKVIIKGTYVETHAEGVNRIKGGSVQVN